MKKRIRRRGKWQTKEQITTKNKQKAKLKNNKKIKSLQREIKNKSVNK